MPKELKWMRDHWTGKRRKLNLKLNFSNFFTALRTQGKNEVEMMVKEKYRNNKLVVWIYIRVVDKKKRII